MEDYSAGIQSFKQQFNLDTPPEGEEDYGAGIESFKRQFGITSSPTVVEDSIPQVAAPAVTETIEDDPVVPEPVIPKPKLNITPANKHLYDFLPEEVVEANLEPEPPIITSLGDSLESGYHRTKANVLNLLPDMAQYREENPWADLAEKAVHVLGKTIPPAPISDNDKRRMRAEAKKSYRKSIEIGRPLSFKEVEDVFGERGFVNYMKGLIGSSAPQMAGSILSLGTMSPLLLSAEMNEGMKDIEGLTLEERIPLVKAGGMVAAALENIGLGVLIRGVPKEALGRVGLEGVTNYLEKSLALRIAGRGVSTSGTEAVTETLQDGTFITGEWLAGKEFQPGEIKHRLQEAGIGGAFLGGTLGAGGKGIQEGISKALADPEVTQAVPEPVIPEGAFQELEDPGADLTLPEQVAQAPAVEEELTIPEELTQAPEPLSEADIQSTPVEEAEEISPPEVQETTKTPPGLVVGKPTAPEVVTEAKPPPPPTIAEAPPASEIKLTGIDSNNKATDYVVKVGDEVIINNSNAVAVVKEITDKDIEVEYQGKNKFVDRVTHNNLFTPKDIYREWVDKTYKKPKPKAKVKAKVKVEPAVEVVEEPEAPDAKVFKDNYYFKTKKAAKAWADSNNWPTDRIISYERGWAVQAGKSGNYAGPGIEPEPYAPAEVEPEKIVPGSKEEQERLKEFEEEADKAFEEGEKEGIKLTAEEQEEALVEDFSKLADKDKEGIATESKEETGISFREQIYEDIAEKDEKMSPNLSTDQKIGILKNKPPKEMEATLRKAVKDKFKLKNVKRSAGIPERPVSVDVSINNMMNAYQNMEGMAASLGIPVEAIGLDETLTLKQEQKGGKDHIALGSFTPLPEWWWRGGEMPEKIKAKKGKKVKVKIPGGKSGVIDPGDLNSLINLLKDNLTENEFAEMTEDPPYIRVQGRFNVFAHEWGHALDFNILKNLDDGWHNGMTGRLRGDKNLAMSGRDTDPALEPWNATDTAEKIKFAFADVINAMYFKDGAVAAKVLELQAKIAKARSEKSVAKYNKHIKELKLGMSKLLKNMPKSQFKTDADMQKNSAYYAMPTEMFARAFEAYVAHKIETDSQGPAFPGTEFLSMRDFDYTSKDFSTFYPKEEDRTKIFAAFNELFAALNDNYFEGVVAEGGEARIIDFASMFLPQEGDTRLLSKDRAKEIDRQVKVHRNILQKELNRPVRHPDKKPWQRWRMELEDLVMHNFVGSKTGTMMTMEKRYPKVKEISILLESLFPDPGGERKARKTWSDAIPIETRRHGHLFKNMVRNNDADLFTEEELKDLRLVATSDPDALTRAEEGNVPGRVLDFVKEARILMDKLYAYAKEAGVNIDYIEENAYLPRYVDIPKMIESPDKFISSAYKLYNEIIWKNDHGVLDVNSAEQLLSIGKISSAEKFSESGNEAIDDLNRIVGRVRKLKSEIKKLDDKVKDIEKQREAYVPKSIRDEFKDNLDRQIAALNKEKTKKENNIASYLSKNQEAFGNGYYAIAEEWAEFLAGEWKLKLEVRNADDPSSNSPVASQFVKKRVLPPEADSIMREFYEDPVDSISRYITGVIRKTEYHKLFNSHKIPEGERKKPTGENRDYLEYLFNKMAEEGVDASDIKQLRYDTNAILGRNVITDLGHLKHLNTLHTFALMGMLPRAAATSLPEPFVAGIKMNSVTKGLEVFAHTLDELFGLVSKDAAQRTQMKKQIGAILGVYDDPDMGMMIANRLGNQLADNPKNQRKMNTFFRRVALMGLTNAQRRATMWVSFQYLRLMGDQYLNPVGDNAKAIADNKKFAELELQDVGIPIEHMERFSKYMQQDLSIDNMQMTNGNLSDMGELLAISANRITSRSIQDPLIASRPRYAETTWGRFIYSIQSFNYSFHRNVIIGELKRLQRTQKHFGNERTAHVFAKLLGPMATLYLGHMLVSTARLYLTDHDRWEEEKEKKNLGIFVSEMAASRTGWMGIAEPWYQTARAIRYQRDFANIAIGATGTYYAKNVEDLIKYFQDVNNSPNTTNAEEKAIRSLYKLIVIPAIVAAVANPSFLRQLGPLAAPAAGALAASATSSSAEKGTAKAIVNMIYSSKGNMSRRKSSSRQRGERPERPVRK